MLYINDSWWFLHEGVEIFGRYYQDVNNLKIIGTTQEEYNDFIVEREGLARKLDTLLRSNDSEQAIERKLQTIWKYENATEN